MRSNLLYIIFFTLFFCSLQFSGMSKNALVEMVDFNENLLLDSSLIDGSSSFIEIPNVFTPNRDGFNDSFIVSGANLTDVFGEIFNRNGQKIGSWNGLKFGWDGRTTSGEEVPTGTYFYIIKATGNDGKDYLKKGSLTLIR